jgi:hypothetical protein
LSIAEFGVGVAEGEPEKFKSNSLISHPITLPRSWCELLSRFTRGWSRNDMIAVLGG